MNCSDFDQRMQMRLDHRLDLAGDPDVVRHVKSCDRCRQRMETWQAIAAVMEPVGHAVAADPKLLGRRLPLTTFAAAALLLMVVGVAGSKFLTVADQVAVTETTNTSSTNDVQPSLDALEWWASVRERDWMAETMPAVRSVQRGVAPLGRSLLQAVTVLTVGDPGQTS